MLKQVTNNLSWVIGGAQGSGVDSAANIFSRACAAAGLNIFGKREYYSNIKGEHSYFTVRVSNKQVRSHKEQIDILVSFDAETIFLHADKVSSNGVIIFNSELINKSLDELPTIDDEARKRITRLFDDSDGVITVKKMLEKAEQKSVRCYNVPYFQ